MNLALPNAQPTDDTALAGALATQLRRAMVDALLNLGGPQPSDQPALTIERAPQPSAPARLAAAHRRGKARDEAIRLYTRCLAYYREAIRPQDQARGVDDVGAAVAAFVAANLCAVHGGTVTEAMLLRLERQLGGLARAASDWDRAPARERQFFFEQMAILAVLVGETTVQARTQGPQAQACVREAAQGYIRQVLGLSADLLSIGPDGLAARTAA